MSKRRWKFKLVFALVIISLLVFLYFWFVNSLKLRNQAQEVINKAENYQVLEDYLNQEYDRCQEFITQEEGDFGSFQYCQGFIEWVSKAPLSD